MEEGVEDVRLEIFFFWGGLPGRVLAWIEAFARDHQGVGAFWSGPIGLRGVSTPQKPSGISWLDIHFRGSWRF